MLGMRQEKLMNYLTKLVLGCAISFPEIAMALVPTRSIRADARI